MNIPDSPIQLDNELKDTSTLLPFVLSGISEGIVILDSNGVIEEWNPAISKITGYSQESVKGEYIWKISSLFFKDKEEFNLFKEDHNLDLNAEIQIVSTNYKTSWLEKRVSVFETRDDIKIILFLKDITPHKEKLFALSEEKKWSEHLNELIITCNQTTDLEEFFKYILNRLTELTGVDCGGIYLIDILQYKVNLKRYLNFDDDVLTNLQSFPLDTPPFNSVFMGKKPLFIEKYNDIHNNSIQSIESLGVIPIVDNEKLIGAILLGNKVSHSFSEQEKNFLVTFGQEIGALLKKMMQIDILKRSEEKMKASEKNYSSIVENANDAIYIIDDENFIYINKKFERLIEYTAEEVCNSNFSPLDIIAPESKNLINYRARARKNGESIPARYEFKLITKSGKVVDVEANTANISQDGSTKVVGVLRDVTHKKLLESQLRQVQKMDGIGQLAGGIAHDFNNLLAGINGNLELLEMDLLPDSSQAEIVKEAKETVSRGANLTRQLLTFSRRTKPVFEPITINSIIYDIKDFLVEIIDPRINIILDLDENLHLINGDRSDLHQMVLNLCINGRDAIMAVLESKRSKREEHIKNQYDIRIETKNIHVNKAYCKNNAQAKSGAYVSITVSDNGIGMSEEVQDHIFEPFYSTKEVGNGSGLGLSSVYGIVEQHHGWIDVQSTLGAGTKFIIYLPKSEIKIDHQKVKTIVGKAQTEQVTILVVDDEQVIRNLAKRLLERKGYRILVAKDGLEALDIYRENERIIDLVILDLTMPKLSGRDVLIKVLKINENAKVILTSGFSEVENKNDLKALGAVDFIPKPYQFPELLKKIKKLLEVHEVEQIEEN